MWICSSYRCAVIHQATTNLTDMKHQTIKQHIELGTSRQLRDAVDLNPLSANFTKCSNTLKQLVCKMPTNCLSVFDHFVGLALKGLKRNFGSKIAIRFNLL